MWKNTGNPVALVKNEEDAFTPFLCCIYTIHKKTDQINVVTDGNYRGVVATRKT